MATSGKKVGKQNSFIVLIEVEINTLFSETILWVVITFENLHAPSSTILLLGL